MKKSKLFKLIYKFYGSTSFHPLYSLAHFFVPGTRPPHPSSQVCPSQVVLAQLVSGTHKRGALQLTDSVPTSQFHVQGPVPETDEGLPQRQRLVAPVGSVRVGMPADSPHCGDLVDALQDILVPPFVPLQVHSQGPVPETDEEFPTAHKLLVGDEQNDAPSADPHTALQIGTGE